MKWPTVLIALALPFLCFSESAAAVDEPWRAVLSLPEPHAVRLETVVDAETLRLGDGRLVRISGLYAPAEAAVSAIVSAAGGRSVRLYNSGTVPDRNGRVSAQIVVVGPAGQPSLWLQGDLLWAGQAFFYPADPMADAPARAMLALESDARREARGLWADAANRVQDARTPATIQPGFRVVEGVVQGVGESRHSLFVNFGPDYRKDFTVVVQRSDREGFAGGLRAVRALQGRHVRVRGLVFQRGGPAIRAMHQQVIEILD